MSAARSAAVDRLSGFFAELGPRWGLPADPCRIHANLYLTTRPATVPELAATLGGDARRVEVALEWLTDYGLVSRVGAAWVTSSDPVALMLRALDERRARELGPALAELHACHRLATTENAVVARQIEKLIALADDLAAIDARLPFAAPVLRAAIRAGGGAARLMDRITGKRARR